MIPGQGGKARVVPNPLGPPAVFSPIGGAMMSVWTLVAGPSWRGGCVERIRRAGWVFHHSAVRNLVKKDDEAGSLGGLPRYTRARLAEAVRRDAYALLREMNTEIKWGGEPAPPPLWPADPKTLDPEARAALEALDRTFFRLMERWGWWTMDWDEDRPPRTIIAPRIHVYELSIIRASLERLDYLADLRPPAARFAVALTDAGATTEPKTTARAPETTAPAIEAEGVADALERDNKRTPARLVRYMIDRESAAFQDVATAVHEDGMVEDSTIRSNVKRTNTELEGMAASFRYKCSGSKVFRESAPVA